MTGVEIVGDVVEILVAGITQLGAGIGTGISSFVTSIAFTTSGDTTSLSIYFVMVLVFGGVALAVGLTTRIFNWLSSLGN